MFVNGSKLIHLLSTVIWTMSLGMRPKPEPLQRFMDGR
jgi:hypothetical protein